MKGYADIADMPEDDRIALMGKMVMTLEAFALVALLATAAAADVHSEAAHRRLHEQSEPGSRSQ